MDNGYILKTFESIGIPKTQTLVYLDLLKNKESSATEVSKIGNTCDFGVNDQGSIFCWKGHRNVVGDVQDNLDDFLEGSK